MLRLARERPSIGVVADQRGRPTAANDLAGATVVAAHRLLEDRGVSGTYHVANAGATTWHEFALGIFEGAKSRGSGIPAVHPVTTSEFPTPARRPISSELSTAKFEQIFGQTLRRWGEPLAEVLDELLTPLAR